MTYNCNIPVRAETWQKVKANKERLEGLTGQKVSYDAVILALLGAEIKFKVVGRRHAQGKRIDICLRELDPVIHI